MSKNSVLIFLSLALILITLSCGRLNINKPGQGKQKPLSKVRNEEKKNQKDIYYCAPHIGKLGFKETSPPAFKVKEYHLPGSLVMQTWCENYIAFYRNTFLSYPQSEVWLFNRKTEEFYPVIRKPVNSKEKFEILGLNCSNSWLVWEELAPGDDLVVPVDWKLYAAPVEPKTKKIGKAVLLDKGNTQVKRRTLTGFVGDNILVWMINYRPPSKRFAAIVSQNLKTGEKKVLAKSNVFFDTVSTSEHFAIASEHKTPQSLASKLHIINVLNGTDTVIDLKNQVEICHFPKYKDGILAISLFEVRDRADLFIKFPEKGPHLVSIGGLDPCFAGHYLFFLREFNKPIGTGIKNGVRQLWGLDLKKRQAFRLEEHFMRDGIMSCDIQHGYSKDTVIVERDITGFRPGGRQKTIIRIYTVDK